VNKTAIILRHEFSQTIKRKSFIIMTLIFPLLALLGILGFTIVEALGHEAAPREVSKVGYVDEVGAFGQFGEQSGVSFISYPDEEHALEALLGGEINEYFVIPSDYLSVGTVVRYTTKRELEPPRKIQEQVKEFMLSNLLAGRASPQIIERAKSPAEMVSLRLDERGEVAADQGGFGAFVVPYIFAILLCMSIFTSSGFLLQGLSEEKENRVMEILLSSVSARQLLTGKVVGLGAAGLLQVLTWLTCARGLAQFASTSIGGMLSNILVPTNFIVLGITYFILGYFLFAILMAGVGSVGSTARESHQISGIFSMMGVIPLMLAGFIIPNPDHVVTTVLTLFPLTAPVTVMMRIGLTEIPIWELGASIALLVASIVVALRLAAKVLRAFLLMYGRRPNIKEIVRSLKEA
jgi:ABC-2 type transport system permease protein